MHTRAHTHTYTDKAKDVQERLLFLNVDWPSYLNPINWCRKIELSQTERQQLRDFSCNEASCADDDERRTLLNVIRSEWGSEEQLEQFVHYQLKAVLRKGKRMCVRRELQAMGAMFADLLQVNTEMTFKDVFSDESAAEARELLRDHNAKGYDAVSEAKVREWTQQHVLPLIRDTKKVIWITNFVRKEHAMPAESNQLDRLVAAHESGDIYVHYQHSKKNSLDQLGSGGQVQQLFFKDATHGGIKQFMAKGWLGLWDSVLILVSQEEFKGSKVIIFEANVATANAAAARREEAAHTAPLGPRKATLWEGAQAHS